MFCPRKERLQFKPKQNGKNHRLVSAIFNTFNFRFRFPPAMAVGKPARVICTPKATRHTCEINNAAPVTGYNVQLTYSPYTITQNIFKLLRRKCVKQGPQAVWKYYEMTCLSNTYYIYNVNLAPSSYSNPQESYTTSQSGPTKKVNLPPYVANGSLCAIKTRKEIIK